MKDDRLPPMIQALLPTYKLLTDPGDVYHLPPEAAATLCLAQAVTWDLADEKGQRLSDWMDESIEWGIKSAFDPLHNEPTTIPVVIETDNR